MRPYQFLNGPWENAVLPTIVKDDPDGGDPHILATLKRVHNPDAIYELCRLANDAVEREGHRSCPDSKPRKCFDCNDGAQACHMNCGPAALAAE
jgi:hypothetical protein